MLQNVLSYEITLMHLNVFNSYYLGLSPRTSISFVMSCRFLLTCVLFARLLIGILFPDPKIKLWGSILWPTFKWRELILCFDAGLHSVW